MKRVKKVMIGLVLAVTLLGNCLSVAAATSCPHGSGNTYIYEKTLVAREYWYTHTEYKNSQLVECTVYKGYYNLRERCRLCGAEIASNIMEEIHVY